MEKKYVVKDFEAQTYYCGESYGWSKEAYLHQNGGKKLPEGFSYNSQNNSKWLTVQELQEIIKEL